MLDVDVYLPNAQRVQFVCAGRQRLTFNCGAFGRPAVYALSLCLLPNNHTDARRRWLGDLSLHILPFM
jgi:hypothetical protein